MAGSVALFVGHGEVHDTVSGHSLPALPSGTAAPGGQGGAQARSFLARPEPRKPPAMNVRMLIAALVTACARRAGLVFAAGILLAAASAWYASGHLGVSTDVDRLFSNSLGWKQRQVALNDEFPQFNDLIVAVVDGKTPEEAELTAAGLAKAMASDTAHVRTVRRPDTSPYFDQEGLLFLDAKPLGTLLDQTIDAQPFLGQLVADPSARGLFAALSLVAMGVEHGQGDLSAFDAALGGFRTALDQAAAGHPQPLSWERLLAGPLADQGGQYHFVLIQPKLDYGELEPGGAATAAVRAAAARLPYVQAGDARVRITGSVPLSDEEFATVAQGAAVGLVGSFLLVLLWLFLAVRSWRLIVPIVLTLFLGLLATTGFAALAVGTLNLISVGFAILFIGIAVDFSIQFSVRFRDFRRATPDAASALTVTARRMGIQVLVAAAATAVGFLAFVPTAFTGVAELGLIAGSGMIIALVCTLTFLPAALTLFRPRGELEEVGFTALAPLDRSLARQHRPILGAFGVLFIAGAVLLPRLSFDADTLDTKKQDTEAMRTLHDLMDDPVANPFTIDVMRPSVAEAAAVGAQLDKLSTVGQTISLQSYVPEDQGPKLALVADAANILTPTLSASPTATPVTPSDLRLAIDGTLGQLDHVLGRLPADSPMRGIDADLHTLQGATDPALLAMNQALVAFLPMQLDRLRTLLTARPVGVSDIPASIARDWLLPDGRARVEAVPKREATGSAGLRRFVAQVQAVVPDAGGSAVTIVATSDTITSAFRDAALVALGAIAVILLLALRRVLDVALVLAPLLLSAGLTVLVMVLAGMQLNYANIIALPLLLGVGVSFNIYFVMNWRAGETARLASPTARAVVFSALTTGTAFGSLALSQHPGTASMGDVLLLSLACTLVATLVFVPALLAALPSPAAREDEGRAAAYQRR